MRFSDASGRKVVSTATAETVGKVDGFVVDLHGPSVAALELKKTSSGDVVRWTDITAFGEDAVTLPDAAVITAVTPELEPLLDKRNRVLGKRVLSTAGDEVGKVKDVEFDPATGAVVALRLEQTDVDGARMVGIGHYAVVVKTG